MAGITISDATHDRVASMWSECGIQFRSNLVYEGGEIPLHAHGYDHVALVTHGWFSVTEIAPNGTQQVYQMASKDFVPGDVMAFRSIGYRKTILAGYKHLFRLIESHDQPGEVLCMWGE